MNLILVLIGFLYTFNFYYTLEGSSLVPLIWDIQQASAIAIMAFIAINFNKKPISTRFILVILYVIPSFLNLFYVFIGRIPDLLSGHIIPSYKAFDDFIGFPYYWAFDLTIYGSYVFYWLYKSISLKKIKPSNQGSYVLTEKNKYLSFLNFLLLNHNAGWVVLLHNGKKYYYDKSDNTFSYRGDFETIGNHFGFKISDKGALKIIAKNTNKKYSIINNCYIGIYLKGLLNG